MISPDRKIYFEGAENFRDLGGYTSIDGKTIKWGKIYRAGKLSELTESDREIFNALNIKTIIDFRRKNEIEKEPDILPEASVINYVHLPVTSGINGRFIVEEVLNHKYVTGIDSNALMQKANRHYVSKALERYSTFFKLLVKEANYPIIFHCSAGKDRTGFAAAMLLSILGITRNTILEDYLESNLHRKATINIKLDKIRDDISAQKIILPLLEVKRDYLDSAYNEIEKLYGTTQKYFEKGLNISREEIEKIKENILE